MQKPRAYIFIDASNAHYYLGKGDWRIDWKRFKAYFDRIYQSPSFLIMREYLPKGSILTPIRLTVLLSSPMPRKEKAIISNSHRELALECAINR
jgi:hypothetical protein